MVCWENKYQKQYNSIQITQQYYTYSLTQRHLFGFQCFDTNSQILFFELSWVIRNVVIQSKIYKHKNDTNVSVQQVKNVRHMRLVFSDHVTNLSCAFIVHKTPTLYFLLKQMMCCSSV